MCLATKAEVFISDKTDTNSEKGMVTIMKKALIAILVLLLVIIGGVTVWFFFSDHRTIDSKAELLELLGMDFSDIEITDIQYEKVSNSSYTDIMVFYNDSDEALQSREYYHREKEMGSELLEQLSGPNLTLSYVPPGHINTMEEIGINTDSIRQYGWTFKDFVIKSEEQRPYEIHWYELDKSYGYKGNVLILTSIDATIKIDVEKILKD